MKKWNIILSIVLTAVLGCRDEPAVFTERPYTEASDFPVGGGDSQQDPTAGDREHDDGPQSPSQSGYVEIEFASHDIENTALTWNLPAATLTQALRLTHQYHDKSRRLEQVRRERSRENFEQGYPGGHGEESFQQTANRELDILVVVDNSNSMKEEQANLAGKLAPLLSSIAETDWQIGVVTTDPADRCLRGLIKKDDADHDAAFRRAVSAGIGGSGNERGLFTAVEALQDGCHLKRNWVRPDSTIAVLIVSDEDNCSDGSDCRDKPYREPEYLLDYLSSIRVLKKSARVYGIIRHPSLSDQQCPTAENAAAIYADVIAKTDGHWGSICDQDYTATLSAISQNIFENLSNKFTLQESPDPATVTVTLNGVEQTSGYTVVGNMLEFSTAPADGSTITVSYDYVGQPMRNVFTLSREAASHDLRVTINGAEVPESDFALGADSRSITLHAPVPERAMLEVEFYHNTALPRVFELGEAYRAGSLAVWIDNVLVSDLVEDAKTGRVTFPQAPLDGAEITFKYAVKGMPIYSYPMNVPEESETTLTAKDADTGEAVDFSYESGTVTIEGHEFVENRIVLFSYANPARETLVIDLPSAPAPGRIIVSDQQTYCQDALIVDGLRVDASHCGFSTDVGQVTVEYEHVLAAHTRFFVPLPAEAGALPQTWQVWVNDVLTDEYWREGDVVVFPQELPLGSVVAVRVDF